MQFSLFCTSPTAGTRSATDRLRFRSQRLVCVLSLVGILSGTPLRAESDVASLAPWQVHREMQPVGYTTEQPPRQYERIARPMGQIAEPPVYEGIGQWSEEGAVAGLSQTCSEEWGCPSECEIGVCPDPFRSRFWFSGEYLMWWGKSSNLPPLATTSVAGTARNQAGVLGLPGTSTLIGGRGVDLGIRSGARFTLGCWMSPYRDEAFEATYLFFGSGKMNYRQTSNDHSILARPFYNAQAFQQDAVILAYPNQQTGWLDAAVSNELTSLALLYRKVVVRGCNGQLDFLAGYRYSRFAENLAVDSSTTYIGRVGVIPIGTVIGTSDWFGAENEFHGGELGISAKTRHRRLSFEFLAKLALGGTRSRLRVAGATTVAVPQQAPVTYNDGMLALPTNSGTSRQSSFSAIPELGINVGYDLTPRLKATFGYTFLYWSRVARPADQIDMNLNPSQFPPGALVGYPAPEAKFIVSDYWAQGLNFGLDYRY